MTLEIAVIYFDLYEVYNTATQLLDQFYSCHI